MSSNITLAFLYLLVASIPLTHHAIASVIQPCGNQLQASSGPVTQPVTASDTLSDPVLNTKTLTPLTYDPTPENFKVEYSIVDNFRRVPVVQVYLAFVVLMAGVGVRGWNDPFGGLKLNPQVGTENCFLLLKALDPPTYHIKQVIWTLEILSQQSFPVLGSWPDLNFTAQMDSARIGTGILRYRDAQSVAATDGNNTTALESSPTASDPILTVPVNDPRLTIEFNYLDKGADYPVRHVFKLLITALVYLAERSKWSALPVEMTIKNLDPEFYLQITPSPGREYALQTYMIQGALSLCASHMATRASPSRLSPFAEFNAAIVYDGSLKGRIVLLSGPPPLGAVVLPAADLLPGTNISSNGSLANE